MSESSLGRRFERLLILSAPLSLLSALVLFVAVATTAQQELKNAQCLANAADVLASKLPELDIAWTIAPKPKADGAPWSEYASTINMALIPVRPFSCWNDLRAESAQRFKVAPQVIIDGLRADAAKARAVPIRLGGVQLPDKATISVFGTSIQIELLVFVSLLQIVLGPLLVLWLGSLHATRSREILVISVARRISDVYPHVINVYPSGAVAQLRKLSWAAYYLPRVVCTWFAFVRVGLSMIFVAPPVVAYVYGLGIRLLDVPSVGPFIGVMVVLCFAMLNVIVEFHPCHRRKIFPGPAVDWGQSHDH